MSFSSHKSAKRREFDSFIICTVFLLMFIAGELYITVIMQESAFLSQPSTIWLFIIFFVVISSVNFYLYKSPDKWMIQITATNQSRTVLSLVGKAVST